MVFGSIYGAKSNLNDLSNPHRGMRVAEAYLNRAEANIRLFLENGNENLRISALTDLNYLREHRFRQPYEDVNITDGQTLLEFCLDERRKELAFDDHRWFDLRRYAVCEKYPEKKEVRHALYAPATVSNGMGVYEGEYVLKPYGEDAAWLMPIPDYEITYNKGEMKQNDEREERGIQ